DLRHEKRRQEEGFERLAAGKAKAHQPNRGGGAKQRGDRPGQDAYDQAHPEERADIGIASEKFREPMQGDAARRKREDGARAERYADDDDKRRQETDIDSADERNEEPRRPPAHRPRSSRAARRVANSAENISASVSNTKVSARLDALGQLNETSTSS